jgi:hypothetical protein
MASPSRAYAGQVVDFVKKQLNMAEIRPLCVAKSLTFGNVWSIRSGCEAAKPSCGFVTSASRELHACG